MPLRGITVIICCYNSIARISKTLEFLSHQLVKESISWEIILVDNASSDNTADYAMSEWRKYNCRTDFFVVKQDIPGLNNARKMGIDCAKYDFIIFCDDDNWLFEDYIERAFEIMDSNPEIGVLGGQGIAETEIAPPEWLDLTIFATGPQSKVSGDITTTRTTVYGAGSIFRKSVLVDLKNNGFTTYLTDRKGSTLSSGGDAELCWAVSLAGYKIWYDENLKFYHFISKDRLSFKYVKRMEFGNGYSSFLHIPYFNKIIQTKRKAIKDKWWWRFFAMLSIIIRQVYMFIFDRANVNIHSIISYKRNCGFLMASVCLRKKYKLLFHELEHAKWVVKKEI